MAGGDLAGHPARESERTFRNSRLDRSLRVCLDSRLSLAAIANSTGYRAPDLTREWSQAPMSQEAGNDTGGHRAADKVARGASGGSGQGSGGPSSRRPASESRVGVAPTRDPSPSWVPDTRSSSRRTRVVRGAAALERTAPAVLPQGAASAGAGRALLAVLRLAEPPSRIDHKRRGLHPGAPALGLLARVEELPQRFGGDGKRDDSEPAVDSGRDPGVEDPRSEISVMPGRLDWTRERLGQVNSEWSRGSCVLAVSPEELSPGSGFLTAPSLWLPNGGCPRPYRHEFVSRFQLGAHRGYRVAPRARLASGIAETVDRRRSKPGPPRPVLDRTEAEKHEHIEINRLDLCKRRGARRSGSASRMKARGRAEESRVPLLTSILYPFTVPEILNLTDGEESLTDEARDSRRPCWKRLAGEHRRPGYSRRFLGGGGRLWCARRTGPSDLRFSICKESVPC